MSWGERRERADRRKGEERVGRREEQKDWGGKDKRRDQDRSVLGKVKWQDRKSLDRNPYCDST